MTENQLPPVKIAFIIDNKVVDILHTDERLAAIMLSNPIIINVTGENGQHLAQVNDLYDPNNGSFISTTIVDDSE